MQVRGTYVPERSSPAESHYFFSYRVRISNEGEETVQLVSREWIITDADGNVERVKGPGVVGEQPHLQAGETFQYTSGCMLATARGTMHGTYQMVRDDGSGFDAEIGKFALELPMSLN